MRSDQRQQARRAIDRRLRNLETGAVATPHTGWVRAIRDALGMTTVAEGVEQPVQQHFLAAQGCPLSQGRLFGGALPPREMTARLRSERA